MHVHIVYMSRTTFNSCNVTAFLYAYYNREGCVLCRVTLDSQDRQDRKERQDHKVLKDPEDFQDHKDLQEPTERMVYKDRLVKEDLR